MQVFGILLFVLIHEDEIEGAGLVEIGYCLIHGLAENVDVLYTRMCNYATCDFSMFLVDL